VRQHAPFTDQPETSKQGDQNALQILQGVSFLVVDLQINVSASNSAFFGPMQRFAFMEPRERFAIMVLQSIRANRSRTRI
jgi:hypothetical protein